MAATPRSCVGAFFVTGEYRDAAQAMRCLYELPKRFPWDLSGTARTRASKGTHRNAEHLQRMRPTNTSEETLLRALPADEKARLLPRIEEAFARHVACPQLGNFGPLCRSDL